MPVKFGLTLSSEEHDPRRLVDIAALAEAHGFDFVSISDHYHPWLDDQGHSPFVWSILGAIAERTERIDVGVGVTCPTTRIHPAVLAQATATCASLLEGRFTWGVGTGEAFNEHILGDRWPPADQRFEQLEEAIEIVRRLWTGEQVTYRGRHYCVENARIYDPPPAMSRRGLRLRVRRGGARRPASATGCGRAAIAAVIQKWRASAERGRCTRRSACAGRPTETPRSKRRIIAGARRECRAS